MRAPRWGRPALRRRRCAHALAATVAGCVTMMAIQAPRPGARIAAAAASGAAARPLAQHPASFAPKQPPAPRHPATAGEQLAEEPRRPPRSRVSHPSSLSPRSPSRSSRGGPAAARTGAGGGGAAAARRGAGEPGPDSLGWQTEPLQRVSQLHDGAFVTLRNAATGEWLVPPYHRRGPGSARPAALDRLLRVDRHSWKGVDGWAIRCRLGTYLVEEVSHRLSIDRRRPRSMEQFMLEFPRSLAGRCLLRNTKTQRLVAAKTEGEPRWGVTARKTTQDELAAQWEAELVRCGGAGDADCFGPPPARTRPEEWTALHSLAAPMPLFTSPKHPDSDETMLNQLRSFDAWRSLAPHVVPVVVSTERAVLDLAREHGVEAVGPEKVELHPRFKQPTYRGLFRSAFAAAPAAQHAMYTNSDLIFTASLLETLDAVFRFVHAKYPGRPLFMVGQRTNVNVPNTWRVGSAGWEADVEDMERRGNVFQTDAEDYFLVSRGAWDFSHDIPDFVVGGRAFDNWFVTHAVNDPGLITVDASRTLVVIHQNHDTNKSCGRYCSHSGERKARSDYNANLGKMHGGWGKGRTTDCEWATVRTSRGVEVLKREQFFLD
eukprot:TRINITY_DN36535_c0_g1_i1.p1 TRINITY_DN36535_c0_g1~~TRINITY_DN36535_c0_g1_i1.p1  ORF type:complete len:626 (+),score=109.25 TRINITY_DN36535_c0_g1_i1:73-1878(+)